MRVETDPDLIAKAAAGATRIRLRAATSFSSYDRDQLLNHEAFVHSLTALNGRAQPILKSLARSSPRITATQEGLAVFAELMSGAIDIARMKRISLRILGIDMALRGADFIEVFRFFLDAGQSEGDSFSSAQRVFRGVAPTGGAATADAIAHAQHVVIPGMGHHIPAGLVDPITRYIAGHADRVAAGDPYVEIP